MASYRYVAYGLGITSVLRLPGLQETGDPETKGVAVRFGKCDYIAPKADGYEHPFCFGATGENAYFFWSKVGTFVVRKGEEIIIDALPTADNWLLSLFISGTGLAVILHQRNLLVLHASAAVVNKVAVGFLGGSGWGKSTMVAALRARGHGIVADDVLAVDCLGKREPIIFPSFPNLKLWPEALSSLGENPTILPLLHPDCEKRSLSVTDHFSMRPVTLRKLYVLAEGDSEEIAQLAPQQAFLEVIRHSYLACAGKLRDRAIGTHLRQSTDLCTAVSICLLRRRRSLGILSEVADLVERDVGRHDLRDIDL